MRQSGVDPVSSAPHLRQGKADAECTCYDFFSPSPLSAKAMRPLSIAVAVFSPGSAASFYEKIHALIPAKQAHRARPHRPGARPQAWVSAPWCAFTSPPNPLPPASNSSISANRSASCWRLPHPLSLFRRRLRKGRDHEVLTRPGSARARLTASLARRHFVRRRHASVSKGIPSRFGTSRTPPLSRM